MITYEFVEQLVQQFGSGGSGFVSAPLTPYQRDIGYKLMEVYGCALGPKDSKPTDQDMIVLYSTARKDAVKGRLVAQRIHAKHSANPIFGDQYTPPAEAWPPTPPVARPAPEPEAPKPADTLQLLNTLRQYVKRSDMELYVSDEITDAKKALADTLIKYGEALPQVVADHVAHALANATPTHLVVTAPASAAPVALGLVHNKTAQIIAALGAGVNVYLHGPAGSGKTTVARKCAEAFGLPFHFAAKVESEYLLLGFKNAQGETVRTSFREAYEHGGVFLFDELDGSSPGAVVALNAALANGICPFPDGTISRHPNFKCIAAGNTKLTGANREYVGRNQLDAASVDRFAFIEFGYDEALERAIATNPDWCKYVQSARRAVAARALKHLVTPRATLDGCTLLASGFDWADVETMVLWKGLDVDTVKQLQGAMDFKRPEPEQPHATNPLGQEAA